MKSADDSIIQGKLKEGPTNKEIVEFNSKLNEKFGFEDAPMVRKYKESEIFAIAMKRFMVKELYEGVPFMTFKEFLEKGDFSLDSIREQAGKINISSLWTEALNEARIQLKLEIVNGVSSKKEIEVSLSSFKFRIPFLFKAQQESLELKRDFIIDEIADKKFSISNGINYYETLKKEIKHVQKEMEHIGKIKLDFLRLNRELSTKHGIDLLKRETDQSVVVRDNETSEYFVATISKVGTVDFDDNYDPMILVNGAVGTLSQILTYPCEIVREARNLESTYNHVLELLKNGSEKVFLGEVSQGVVKSAAVFEQDVTHNDGPKADRLIIQERSGQGVSKSPWSFIEQTEAHSNKFAFLSKEEYENHANGQTINIPLNRTLNNEMSRISIAR